MTTASERLKAMGLVLPPPTPTHFSYLPAMRFGNTVHVAGQIPKTSVDTLLVQGRMGEDVSEEMAREAARLCILHALSWVAQLADGDLDDVQQILRVNYYFQVGKDASQRLSAIADAGSDLLVGVLGHRGKHPRSVIGVWELPRNAPVLVDMDVFVASPKSSAPANNLLDKHN